LTEVEYLELSPSASMIRFVNPSWTRMILPPSHCILTPRYPSAFPSQ
jgi:hypothetical protein